MMSDKIREQKLYISTDGFIETIRPNLYLFMIKAVDSFEKHEIYIHIKSY